MTAGVFPTEATGPTCWGPRIGTGIELPNIDAVLLLALVDKGHSGAVTSAHKTLTSEAGDIIVGGKTLSKGDTEKLLAERLKTIETVWLDKLIEIGVVSAEP